MGWGVSSKSTDTETLARLMLDEVICRYGTPLYLHSDQGANMTSKLWGLFATYLELNKYHSQGNGQVERFNRTLEAMLAKVISDHQLDWDTRYFLHIGLLYTKQRDSLLSKWHLVAPLSSQLKHFWISHRKEQCSHCPIFFKPSPPVITQGLLQSQNSHFICSQAK